MNAENQSNHRAPWNKGRLIGQKSPLKSNCSPKFGHSIGCLTPKLVEIR